MDPKTICRCCLAQGIHKDLFSVYIWLGNKEIYAEMLQECFSFMCSQDLSTCICEKCIEILRSASSFRRQVYESENILKKLHLERNNADNLIKLEPKSEDENSSESDNCFLANLLKDKKQLPEEKKGRVKVKNKIDDSLKNDNLGKHVISKSQTQNNISEGIMKSKKIIVKVPKTKTVDVKINWSDTRIVNEKSKHNENLSTILKYSNAMPFKNKSLLGYICGYCEATYPDPADLRIHTEVDHKKERLALKINKDMTEYVLKLDVYELSCTLCEAKMKNLSNLKQHLAKEHDKNIHTDVKDHFIQFILKKGDMYDCALCTSRYETFKMLKQHMNVHYDNFICQKCDAAFVTKRSLMTHKAIHREGSFKCDLCEKIFTNKQKMIYHQKTKHMRIKTIKNCPYCNVPFQSYYQRNQHLVKVHNLDKQYKCNICSKAFVLKSLLMSHIKKNHLMERNCQCSECGYRFFSKKALKAHMVKHTGEKKYCCEVCNKAYARKYTLREHMRIHNNDRRFKCELCGSGFVQKCSLKSHLLSHHGVSMAASEINITN